MARPDVKPGPLASQYMWPGSLKYPQHRGLSGKLYSKDKMSTLLGEATLLFHFCLLSKSSLIKFFPCVNKSKSFSLRVEAAASRGANRKSKQKLFPFLKVGGKTFRAWLFKTNNVVSQHSVKISNANIRKMPKIFVEKNARSFSTQISVYFGCKVVKHFKS